MEYFRYLSLIFGGYIAGASLWITFFPGQYKALGSRFMTEKKPGWYLPLSIAWALLIGYTWNRYLAFQSPITFAVSLVFSTSLIKIYMVAFKYDTFRAWGLKFLDSEPMTIRTFGIILFALGVLLVAIGMSL